MSNKTFSKTLIIGVSFAQALFAWPAHAGVSFDLSVNPQAANYNVTFSGIVRSHKGPVHNADVRVSLQTSCNRDIVVTGHTSSSGRFQLQLAFKEVPNSSMDWQIAVQRPHTEATTMEGRRILDENTSIVMEKTITMDQANLELAMR